MSEQEITILYVEDDESLSYVTSDNLERKGYDITLCADGQSGWNAFREQHFDLCIIDVMLPKMDGFSLAEKIREADQNVPIIFLTARTMKEDRIKGLKLGADDYLTKPFSIEELELKIEIFLRRSIKEPVAKDAVAVKSIGNSQFDPVNNTITTPEGSKKLTVRESELLCFLADHKNNVLKREDILDKVWKNSDFFISRSLDVFISRLRKYLSSDSQLKIENVHGVGFRLVDTSSRT